MTPLQFTRNVRSLNRLRQIAQVLTQHGFGHVVAQIDLGRFLPVWMKRTRPERTPIDESVSSVGRRLAMACTDLGPTFIKLGQLISTRPDIVPAQVLSELRALQDKVPAFDTSEAKAVIAEELGQPVSDCFREFSDEPIASGSIGQVYRARTQEGTEVVVKVRRPGIDHVIRLDMQLLEWLASSLEEFAPELAAYQPAALVAELEQMLTRELDYVNEAAITARFHDAFADDVGIRTPRVYWEYCGPRVLTVEALPGRNLDEFLQQAGDDEHKTDKTTLARRFTDCYFKQIFELGYFHADPHPGNVLVDPPTTIGLIDFGQVGAVSSEFMTELIILVYACANKEMKLVIDTLVDMGAVGTSTSHRQLQRELQLLLYKYHGLPIARFDLSRMLYEFVDIARRQEVTIPREMTQLIKALATAAGVIARLDPEFDLLKSLVPRLREAMKERFSPVRMARASTMLGWDLINVVRKAPRQLQELLRSASAGQWQLNVRHENIDRLIRELDRSSNRLALAVVIAGIIIGSSAVFSAQTDLLILGAKVQYFGVFGYLVAGVMGLGLSWAIFRSGRLH